MKKIITLLSLLFFSSQLLFSQIGYIFKENEFDTKKGVLNSKGEVLFKNEFKSINYLYGYLLTQSENNHGNELYVFKTGQFLDDSVKQFICVGSNHALVEKHFDNGKTKWGIIDKKGKQITGYIYDGIYNKKIIDNHVQLKQNGKFLLVNTSGKAVISTESRAKFLSKLKKYQKKGEDIDFFDVEIEEYNSAPTDIFKNFTTGKYGLKKGNQIVLTDKYTQIEETGCDNYIIKANGKYGIALPNGKVILSVKCDRKPTVAYWKIIAVKNGKYGAYDGRTGATIIESKYGFLTFL